MLTVEFEIDGQTFTALNGGPQFKFTEPVSFQVMCDTQKEVDYFWNRLSDGGQEGACGWLKDKYGLSWQIVPSMLPDLLVGDDSARRNRVIAALMKMRKAGMSGTLRILSSIFVGRTSNCASQ